MPAPGTAAPALPFDLGRLADPDPERRRAALTELPLAEYERVPEGLVRELAAQLADEIGDSLPETLVDAIGATEAIGFQVDLARALDAAAASPEALALAGRVEVLGGARPSSEVVAQMPIHAGGWFATALADPSRPLTLHLQGHAPLSRSFSPTELASKQGSGLVILREPLRLAPLAESEQAGIRGRLELDGPAPAGAAPSLRAYLAPYPINSPSGRYAERARWPDPIAIPVAADGGFSLRGFAPARYHLVARAEGFEAAELDTDLAAGSWLDLGALRLTHSDLSTYLEAGSPAAPPLAWIDTPAAAFAAAAEQGRPLLAYTTASWCLPCQQLKATTFTDPWVRGALAEMVLARVDEDPAFNAAHGASGYPSFLVFDAAGREAYRFSGYQAPVAFLRQLLRAFETLGLPAPAALRPLIEAGRL